MLSLIGALAATDNFLENFNNFLLLILYLFIPWTAVNLVDYYVVRRGHYAIAEIFKPNGIYGRWGWRGIARLPDRLRAMVPFFSVGTLFDGLRRQGAGRRGHLVLHRPAGGRHPVLGVLPLDRRRGREAGGRRPRPTSWRRAAHQHEEP